MEVRRRLAPGRVALVLALLATGCEGAAPFDPANDDESCTHDLECHDGAVCVDGTCRVATCDSDDDCPTDGVCLGGICATRLDTAPGDDETPPPPSTPPPDDGPMCVVDDDCASLFGCERGCVCEAGTCAQVEGSVPNDPDADPPPTDDNPGTDSPIEEPPVDEPPTDDVGDPLTGPIIDVGGYVLEDAEQQPVVQSFTLPSGTLLTPGDLVVIVRSANQTEFEAHFGVSLGDNVRYIDAVAGNNAAPIINGGERWVLRDANGAIVDGSTVAGQSGASYQRQSPGQPDTMASWSEVDDTACTPGTTTLPANGVGLVISEWSDASGNGNYPFEFVELYYAP